MMGFAVVPHIQGVTKPIKRILGFDLKVAQNSFMTWGNIFGKPKDRIAKEQTKDAIYSIPWNDCNQKYIGQTKRQFRARLKGKLGFVKARMCNLITRLRGKIPKLSPWIRGVTIKNVVWKLGI